MFPASYRERFLCLLIYLRGRFRIFWGFCPACNSDAPELDDCWFCHGERGWQDKLARREMKAEWCHYYYPPICKGIYVEATFKHVVDRNQARNRLDFVHEAFFPLVIASIPKTEVHFHTPDGQVVKIVNLEIPK